MQPARISTQSERSQRGETRGVAPSLRSANLMPMSERNRMQIDRSRATEALKKFTERYDPKNPRIALKLSHTLRVAQNSERIARSERLPKDEVDLAWLLGLLHDIGRFEQVRRFDTFVDAKSVSHADLGCEILFGERGTIRSFVSDDSDDGLLRAAVGLHSELALPGNLAPRTRLHCEILRDADKIDILKVNCLSPIEDIYGVTTQEMRESGLTPEVVDTFYGHRCVPRSIRREPADMLVGHICFAYELARPASLALMLEQGHLQEMLSRTFDDPATEATFRQMEKHMASWLEARDRA